MTMRKNPYVGPRTFREEDEEVFFGRDREARDLLSLVLSERLVLFYAQSGAGKSSLINTRLIPCLREGIRPGRREADSHKRFEVLPVGRVGGEVPTDSDVDNVYVHGLMYSLVQSDQDLSRCAGLSLSEFLLNLTTDDGHTYYFDESESQDVEQGLSADVYEYEILPRVLIIDQFEEIFTTNMHAWEHREDFFRQLRRAMSDDPYLWVVLSMREDYVPRLDRYAHVLPGRLRTRYHMERMRHDAALEAVTKPVEEIRPFEAGVAEQLVENLALIRSEHGQDQPDELVASEFVEPVQLQVVCYQLWEELRDRPGETITQDDLRALAQGKDLAQFVNVALLQFYEDSIANVMADDQVDVSERQVRVWFNEQLITEAGTRGLVWRGEDETGGLPNSAVDLLQQQFVIGTVTRAGSTWHELTHDRLIGPILEANRIWHLERAEHNPLMQAAQRWKEADYDESKLYLGTQLKETLATVDRDELEPLVQEFLTASEDAQLERERAEAARQAKEAQQFRRLSQAASIMAVLFLVAAIAAAFAWNNAKEQEALAKANAVTAEANAERAKRNADRAATNEAEAKAARETAEADRKEAVQAEAIAKAAATEAARANLSARALRLADASKETVDSNPTLSTLLAITAVTNTLNTELMNSALPQAEDVLRQVVLGISAGIAPQTQIHGASGSVYGLDLSPDATRLVSGGEDGTARVWDVETGTELLTLSDDTEVVYGVSFSPDGTQIASGSLDGSVRLWDAGSGEQLRVLEGHNDGVVRVTFSPDGTQVATASFDGSVKLWNTSSGQEIATFIGHDGNSVAGVSFSPNGQYLAGGGSDGTVVIWDTQTGSVQQRLTGPHEWVIDLAFSPDGDRIAGASLDGTTWIWNTEVGTAGAPLEHDAAVWGVAFIDAQGRQVVTADENGTVTTWRQDSTDSWQRNSVVSAGVQALYDLALSANGTHLAVGGQDDAGETAVVFTLPSSETDSVVTEFETGSDRVADVAFSPDGTQLAVLTPITITIWDTDSLTRTSVITDTPALSDTSMAFTQHDNLQLLELDADTHSARRWSIQSDSVITASYPDTHNVIAATIGHDGSRIVTLDQKHTVTVWDSASSQTVECLKNVAETGDTQPTTPTPSATTPKSDATPKAEATPAASVPGARSQETSPSTYLLSLSPNNQRLAIAHESTVFLCDLDSEETFTFNLDEPPVSIAVHDDSARLAAASSTGSIKVWKWEPADDGAPATIEGSITIDASVTDDDTAGTVAGVTFDRGGTQLAAATEDGTIRLYTLDINRLLDVACQYPHRNFTYEEWREYARDVPDYPNVCGLPAHQTVIDHYVREDQIETAERLSGATSEKIATSYLTLAEGRIAQEEYESAHDAIRAAIAKDQQVPSERPRMVVRLYNELCQTDYGAAEAACQEAARWATTTSDIALNFDVCLAGATDGHADSVAPACERAVDLLVATEDWQHGLTLCERSIRAELDQQVMPICEQTVEIAIAQSTLSSSLRVCRYLANELDRQDLAAPACAQVATRAQSIEVGQTVDGAIEDETPWIFDGTAGQIINIVLEEDGGDIDTIVTLLESDGTQLAHDQDGGSGYNALIRGVVLPEDGSYLIIPETDTSNAGAYTLSLANAPVEEISAEATVEGVVENNTLWAFEGRAGQLFSIAMDVVSGDMDPLLSLIGPDGNEIARSSIVGDGNALIRAAVLSQDGTYLVIPSTYGDGNGSYRLALESVEPSPLEVGTHVSGNVENGTLWAFEGRAGQVISIALDDAGSGIDPYVTLVGPDGSEIAYNDDFDGLDARIADVTLPDTGTYLILAGAYDDSGGYMLLVEEQ